MYLLYLL